MGNEKRDCSLGLKSPDCRPERTRRPARIAERLGVALCDSRGAALIEFALVAPVFLMLMLGILGYGGYFWRAHVFQQVANDSARAALPGLTASEREALALATAGSEIAALAGVDPARTSSLVAQTADTVTVQIRYDGSADGFLNLSIVPLPSKIIRRVAAVRLGGL